jgi:hypothetical protein
VIDGLGVLLLALYVGAVWVAARNGGASGPMVLLVLTTGVALLVGRVLGRVDRVFVPAAVVIVAIVVGVAAGPALRGGPLEGPFGYRNATGAFYVQAAIAALMLAGSSRWTWLRVLAIVAAVPFAIVAALDSSAAGVSLLASALALIGLGGAGAVRWSIVLAATVVGLVLVGTVVLGSTYQAGDDGPVVRALTERRLVLWHESLSIIAAHPGGVGPGRFKDVDPTAIRDPDASWAHNEFLQQGVELGWAGLVLLVLVFLWGFARLWVHPAPDVVVALGAASLAALGIHASVDYVLHFPAVPLTAAVLVGTAQAVPSRRFRRDRDESRQEGVEGGRDPAGVAGAPTAG